MQSAAPTTGGIFVSGLSRVMDDGRRSSDALGQRSPERHGVRYRAKCDAQRASGRWRLCGLVQTVDDSSF
jgi:hypothetical protein